jgi:hypothetical protein
LTRRGVVVDRDDHRSLAGHARNDIAPTGEVSEVVERTFALSRLKSSAAPIHMELTHHLSMDQRSTSEDGPRRSKTDESIENGRQQIGGSTQMEEIYTDDGASAGNPAHGEGPGDQDTVSGRRVLAAGLAVVSVAAAVIHFAVAGAHFAEYWLFGVFMLVVAWLQLIWALAAVVRPTRLLLWAGTVLNAGVVTVYILTRTVGDMIGPTPNAVEPFGFGDGLCTVLEAVIAAGCLWLLFAGADRRLRRSRLLAVPAATGALVAVLLSVALVDGGPEMVMTMSDSTPTSPAPAMQMSGAKTASVTLATTTPARAITMPDPDMQMGGGMRMASSTPCVAVPTKSQEQAAVNLVDTTWRDDAKYRSLAAARSAGYRPLTPTGRKVVHYVNPASYRATVRGGPILDSADPQSLVYANTPHGAVLAAAMFITAPGGATPQPGGCLTQWHVHTNLCMTKGLHVVGTTDPSCPAGSENQVTPAMLHVWFVPVPGGPTAIDATDAQVVHAAESVPAPLNARA